MNAHFRRPPPGSAALLTGLIVVLNGCAGAGSGAGGAPAPDPDIVVMRAASGGTGGVASNAVAVMTFDELLHCAQQIVAMDTEDGRLDRQHASIESTRTRLRSLSDSIDVARPKVDTRSTAAVNAFNQRLNAYQAAEKAFNLAVDAYNAALAARRLQTNEFNAGCANRSYRRSHYATLPADLRQAVERSTKRDPSSDQ